MFKNVGLNLIKIFIFIQTKLLTHVSKNTIKNKLSGNYQIKSNLIKIFKSFIKDLKNQVNFFTKITAKLCIEKLKT